MCEHAVAYVEIESSVLDAPGFTASVGCERCGERLRQRVTVDARRFA